MSTKKKREISSKGNRARGRDLSTRASLNDARLNEKLVAEAEGRVERAVEAARRVRFRRSLEERLRTFGESQWTGFDNERAFAIELAAERLGYESIHEAFDDGRIPEVLSDAIEAASELGL